MAINEDLIKVQKGDEVKIEKEGNKYYVKTLEGESLSGQNTSGFTGKRNARRFVFSSEADAEKYIDIRGYYKEGEKPEPVVEAEPEPEAPDTGGFGGELEGAYEEAETRLDEIDTDLSTEAVSADAPKDLAEAEAKSEDAAEAAGEALGEVASAATSAFGGETVGDTTQDTSSFTEEAATAASVAQPSGGGGGAAPSPAPVTVATGSAAGGAQEAAAAKSVGPAEDEAVEYYTRGRRASILTGPQGLLGGEEAEEEDRSLRRRRSLLAG
jgi:hypothetical protein